MLAALHSIGARQKALIPIHWDDRGFLLSLDSQLENLETCLPAGRLENLTRLRRARFSIDEAHVEESAQNQDDGPCVKTGCEGPI